MLVAPETTGREGAEMVERRRKRCRGESMSDTESIRTESGESREARVAPARRVVRAGSGGTGGISCVEPLMGVSIAIPEAVRITPFMALPRFGLLFDASRLADPRFGGVSSLEVGTGTTLEVGRVF